MHRRRVPALVSAMVVLGDGEEVMVGEVDGGLRRWGRVRGELGAPVAVHKRAVNALSRGRDGRWLASGSSDGSVAVMALPEGVVRARLAESGGHGAVTALSMSPGNEVVAVGYADGALLRVEAASGRPLGAAWATAQQAVTALVYSADGGVLWSGGLDGSLLTFDAASGGRLCSTDGAGGAAHADGINSLGLRPQGDVLASGGRDGRIRLWTVASGGCLRALGEPLLQHRGGVSSLSFSRDGGLLASGGDDRAVVIWDVERRQMLGRPLQSHRRAVTALAFAAGRVLLTGDSETVWRWSLDESEWTARACERAGRNLSMAEWRQAFGDRAYCRICADAPAGGLAPSEAPLCPP